MKKILEVLQYGENDIRFNTDIKNVRETLQSLLPVIALNMATRLWGGNEAAVLAVIRVLAVADLSLSVNRKEMIRHFDEDSLALWNNMMEAKKEFEKKGGKIAFFPPSVKPSGIKS